MTNVTLTNCAAVETHLPNRPSYKTNLKFTSLETDIFLVFQTIFDFDIQWILPESGTWGVKNKATGEWDGCVKEMEAGRADLSSAGLTITLERLEVSMICTVYCTYFI